MKKRLFCILIMIFVPKVVFAKDLVFYQNPIFYKLERIVYLDNDASSHYNYAKSYIYEDGMYTLTGEIRNDSLDSLRRFASNWLNSVMYTCKDSTAVSCKKLYVAFPSQYTQINSRTLSLKIENGETIEDVQYLVYASSFERRDGKYHLLEDKKFDLSTILNGNNILSHTYTCLSKETDCETLYVIDYATASQLILTSSEYDYVLARKYKYSDGNVILDDIVDYKWPNYPDYTGYYTCLSKDTNCGRKAYLTTSYVPSMFTYSYEFIESTTNAEWSYKEVLYSGSTIEGVAGNKTKIAKYINDVSSVKVIDEDIIQIEDGNISFLRKGETDIVQGSHPENILYHVKVDNVEDKKGQTNLSNPSTNRQVYSLLMFVFILVALICFRGLQKKEI